jgi:hypothetical protein
MVEFQRRLTNGEIILRRSSVFARGGSYPSPVFRHVVAVSSDDLHRRCAPLFLRPDQEFVWGIDMKPALKAVNAHFLQLPEEKM